MTLKEPTGPCFGKLLLVLEQRADKATTLAPA